MGRRRGIAGEVLVATRWARESGEGETREKKSKERHEKRREQDRWVAGGRGLSCRECFVANSVFFPALQLTSVAAGGRAAQIPPVASGRAAARPTEL